MSKNTQQPVNSNRVLKIGCRLKVTKYIHILRLLKESFVQQNSFLAFLLADSAHFCAPAIILGILKQGCAFVPLLDFNAKISESLQIEWIITGHVPPENYSKLQEFKIFGITLWLCRTSFTSKPSTRKFAYAMTTSGSTGDEKIVQVPHKAIVPNIIYFESKFLVNSTDIFFNSAPQTFDPFVVELFTTLYSGAALLMVPPSLKSRPNLLFKAISKNPEPTIIQATPSLIRSLGIERIKFILGDTSQLRILAFGGEAPPSKSQLREWKHKNNKTRLFNVYGVTEVSCWSSCEEVNAWSEDEVTLGEALPFNEFEVRLLEEEGSQEEGAGQLFITTRDKMCTIDEECMENKWHATGDVVKVLHNGKIQYLGRLQETKTVKKMGQKVSLCDIEREALRLPFVENCVAEKNFSDVLKIVLFIVRSRNCKISKRNLQLEVLAHLHANLPSISVPDVIFVMNNFPLSRNSKIDLRKLACRARRQLKRSILFDEIQGEEELKQTVREAWILSLGLHTESEISDESLFITSGGDSVKALLFYGQLLTKLGIESDRPQLLTTILECSFSKIFDCFKDLLKSRGIEEEAIQKNSKVTKAAKEFPGTKDLTAIPDLQIAFMLCKGQSSHLIPDSYNTYSKTELNGASFLDFKEQWKVDFMKCVDASPLIVGFTSGQTVAFVGSHSGKFACVDVHTGLELWFLQLPDRIEATASISQCGARIFVGCYDGSLYCIESQSGTLGWKFETGGMIKSSAVTYEDFVLIGSYDQILYFIKQKDGACEWKYNLRRGSIFATPCLVENLAIVATLGGHLVAVSLENKREIWSLNQGKPFFASPMLLNSDTVVTGNVGGLISFLQPASGYTKYSLQTSGDLFASFTTFKSNLIYTNKTKICCFDFCQFTCMWEFESGTRITSTPFVQQKFLILTCSNVICLIDIVDRMIVWRRELAKEIFSSPILCKASIVFGCRDNFLYCYKNII
ncbi:beta-alanine-activating enzyme [Neocloeon triangulifer]|uniref:beta-alanine-activating enzyme n=1 Tax=Neocloeon triangulifer TaxID=2078957 RepID=UPI00286F17EE|nr:beta-alanine-activating enzyme [Neocloeon triangulifer]